MSNTILTEIKKRYPNAIVYCIIRAGSALFCENCRDTDIIAICDGLGFTSSFVALRDLRLDIICLNINAIDRELNGRQGLTEALATGENLLYGEFPLLDYSWENHKKNALKANYDYMVRRALLLSKKKNVCDKSLVWAFATYFTFLNSSLDFTDEQKEILQKCHDFELPVSYAEELKVNIENLLKEL